MAIDSIFAASRFGLEFERLRLEAASHNVAIANTPVRPGQPTTLMRVSTTGGTHFGETVGFADAGMPANPMIVEEAAPERTVHDPSDPQADAKGMVSYPRVDLVDEMATLVSAGRAYEANVRAFNTLHSMAMHALDIGSK